MTRSGSPPRGDQFHSIKVSYFALSPGQPWGIFLNFDQNCCIAATEVARETVPRFAAGFIRRRSLGLDPSLLAHNWPPASLSAQSRRTYKTD